MIIAVDFDGTINLNGVRGGKLRADIYIDDKAMRP